jgi:hypothetical protein
MIKSRWAVLLCKFADDPAPTYPLLHYQRLFTSVGAGSFNMVDFFRDMSHGQLDVSESQIFGWYTLNQNRSVFAGNVSSPPPGQVNRDGLFNLCVQAAKTAKAPQIPAPVEAFDGILVTMLGNTDLWGGPPGVMRTFCDDYSVSPRFNLSPSPLGQEMGHGYGLDHARQEGSETDYTDPWDVMSVFDSTFTLPNSEWGIIGPGLNAQCMRSRGWLDESRVWKSPGGSFTTTIQLKPLHRHDLPGLLAAELPGSLLVEYRPKDRWDAKFDHSAVFVHDFVDNHSYVLRGTTGNFDLVAGDSFQRGNTSSGPLSLFNNFTKMQVVAIDDASLTATINIVHASPFVAPSLVAQVLFGIIADEGGAYLVGKTIHRVPPRGLANAVIERLSVYLDAAKITDAKVRSQLQREALGAMTRSIDEQMEELASTGGVAAPNAQGGREFR